MIIWKFIFLVIAWNHKTLPSDLRNLCFGGEIVCILSDHIFAADWDTWNGFYNSLWTSAASTLPDPSEFSLRTSARQGDYEMTFPLLHLISHACKVGTYCSPDASEQQSGCSKACKVIGSGPVPETYLPQQEPIVLAWMLFGGRAPTNLSFYV